jgi:hypothetical protein
MDPATPTARASNWFRRAPALFLVLVLLLPHPVSDAAPKRASSPTVYVRFTDERIMKFALPQDSIKLITPYGKLLIPIAKIRSIDFATRIPDADARRAAAAVADLGSKQYRVRRAAEKELEKLGAKAVPALHRALRAKDVEVTVRARVVLNRLRQRLSEDQLEDRPHDVIRTAESRIAGRIEGDSLKASPLSAKGSAKLLPLSDLRTLAVGIDPRTLNAAPNPGNLEAFKGRIGKTFWFKVTGVVGGQIWGTKVYTSDSALATTAVHAGVLKAGQTGVVHVKIVTPPASYAGSTRNGVTSAPYGVWPGAYQFIR